MREKIEIELQELLEKIKEYQEILGSEEKVKQIIVKELGEIKEKFGDERRTSILPIEGEVDIEDLIPNEDCVVTLTHYGYIKRQVANSYKTQKRGGRGVSGMKKRDEDFVEHLLIGSSHDKLVIITNKGIMYCLKCYEIPQSGKNTKGVNIVNLLRLNEEEKIAKMFCVKEFTDEFYLVFVTKKGIIKRTSLDAFKNIRKNGLIALSLNEDDSLVNIALTRGKDELIVATKMGMSIRFEEEKIRPLSRSAKGVIVIRLRENDEVVGMVKVEEEGDILTVSSKGKGRRTKPDEYRLQNRGGFGTLNFRSSEEKGYVVGIELVKEDEDLIIVSRDGIIIRVVVSEISKMSRYGSGVKIMNLKEEDEVVAFSKTDQSDEEELVDEEEI